MPVFLEERAAQRRGIARVVLTLDRMRLSRAHWLAGAIAAHTRVSAPQAARAILLEARQGRIERGIRVDEDLDAALRGDQGRRRAPCGNCLYHDERHDSTDRAIDEHDFIIAAP